MANFISIIISIAFTVLLFALIIGLFKPSMILVWSNKPSRFKLIMYWVFSSFIMMILLVISTANNTENKRHISKENSIEKPIKKDESKLSKKVSTKKTEIHKVDTLREILIKKLDIKEKKQIIIGSDSTTPLYVRQLNTDLSKCYVYHVITKYCNIYEEPSKKSYVSQKVHKDDNILFIRKINVLWSEVFIESTKIKGFVESKYISEGKCIINTTKIRIGAVCKDGSHSNATGKGACSHHGGVSYWLYKTKIDRNIINNYQNN